MSAAAPSQGTGRSTAKRRRPGRPRDVAKRQAIIDATLEVVAEVGYTSLTIDAVAQRAGSNRVLIYRVWDSKAELVRDAIFGSADHLVVPDTGSVVGDLRGFVTQLVRNMRRPAYVMGAPGLTVELLADPALFRDTHRRYVKPTEDGFRTILQRGQVRSEVTGDADPVVLTRIVSGITTSLGQTQRLSEAAIVDVVMATLVGGFVPTAIT